jgi:hypothetical protein
MSSLWPWLALAGAGALHGLNPATGWLLAAGCGLRSGDSRHSLRALAPIATGHVASIAVVATAVALGFSMAEWTRPLMGVVAVVFVAHFCCGFVRGGKVDTAHHAPRSTGRIATGRIGIALWSFVASTVHGSGMMLAPALVPLCLGDSPAREITASGSLPLALAAVAVHALAMLATLGLVAAGAVGGFARASRWCKQLGHRFGALAMPWWSASTILTASVEPRQIVQVLHALGGPSFMTGLVLRLRHANGGRANSRGTRPTRFLRSSAARHGDHSRTAPPQR